MKNIQPSDKDIPTTKYISSNIQPEDFNRNAIEHLHTGGGAAEQPSQAACPVRQSRWYSCTSMGIVGKHGTVCRDRGQSTRGVPGAISVKKDGCPPDDAGGCTGENGVPTGRGCVGPLPGVRRDGKV